MSLQATHFLVGIRGSVVHFCSELGVTLAISRMSYKKPRFHFPTYFCENWCGSFCIILLANELADDDENVTSLAAVMT